MPYKLEDLSYPGGQPAKVEHKQVEHKQSMGVLDMLENMGRTEKAKPLEDVASEPMPKPEAKSVAKMPKITKQEEKKRFGATPDTSRDLYDKTPKEEPKLDFKRFFEPKKEPIVEPPKKIENFDDYNHVMWSEQQLADQIEEYLEKRENKCECEVQETPVVATPIIEEKSITSDKAVKIAVDSLKVLVITCVGLGIVALVVKGIMMLFNI